MKIPTEQMDALRRQYDERRQNAIRACNEKKAALFKIYPEIAENHARIVENAAKQAYASIAGDLAARKEAEGISAALKEERKMLFLDAGLSEDDFLPKFTCPDCADTGYQNGAECHCLTEAKKRLLYRNSHLDDILKEENFSTLRLDLYDDTRHGDKKTPRAIFAEAVTFSRDFCREFGTHSRNILFYGQTGIGKTFLTHCIAKEVLDRGFTVLYFTASELFDTIAKIRFRKEENNRFDDIEDIYNADLLLIDDLGTEYGSQFNSTEVFNLINGRLLRKKCTVISSNLTLNDILDRYTERVASRLGNDYRIFNLQGKDLRLVNAQRKKQKYTYQDKGGF